MSKTTIRSVFIMISALQVHQKLSIISESANICEGQLSGFWGYAPMAFLITSEMLRHSA
jgi:hypothetical protein